MQGNKLNTSKKDRQKYLEVLERSELLTFLLAQMPEKSRNTVKSLLSNRQISVNNKIVTQFNHLLEPGMLVEINGQKIQQAEYQKLKIVFEDPYLIVVEKQAGLLSIATGEVPEETAYHILSEHVKKSDPKNKVFIVHRLDRETSGLMMFAKDRETQKLLQDNWQEIVSERIYVVLVEGQVSAEKGTITSWLKENKAFLVFSSQIPNDGQKAVTHYKVISKNADFTLMQVELETGRKNQIRVHMQDLGHPVVGDRKYGSTLNPIGRLGLHARILAFVHPTTKKQLRFETEIPKVFSKTIK